MDEMGLPGNDKGETGPDQWKSFGLGVGGDTQLLDSPLSPSTLPAHDLMEQDGPAEQHFLEDTMLYDDTVPLDDEFETQIVNLDEQAEAVNFDAETQLIDSQEDCLENLETQIFAEFATQVLIDNESEETHQMEMVGGADDSANGGSIGMVSSNTVERKKAQLSSCGKDENREGVEAGCLSHELCGSGSTPRSFTSIRAASVRASGLAAARSASTNQSDSGSYDVLSSSRSSKEAASTINGLSRRTVSSNLINEVDGDEVFLRSDGKADELRDRNKCKVGSSAVRRLFKDDSNVEMNDDSLDKGEEELNLAGLSYIDSQEPGDLSQENALDFVDQFLKDNLDNLDQGLGTKISTVGKSASVPSARGPQLLAAKRAAAKECGIFDWDDTKEDEGGGDIFCRRKSDFLYGESRLMSRSQNQKKLQGSRLDDRKLGGGPLGPQENIKRLVRSAPPRNVIPRGKIEEKAKLDDRFLKRNLEEDFSAEPIEESSRVQNEEYTVGFDTQLAAEAMEALCRDESPTDKNNLEDHESLNIGVSERKKGLNLPSKCTRRSKIRDRANADLRKKSPISPRRSSRNTKLTEKTLEQRPVVEFDISRSDRTINNGTLYEKLREMGKVRGFSTAVARRTRLSKVADESLRAESLPSKLPTGSNCAAKSGVRQVRNVLSEQSVGLEGISEAVPRCKRSRYEGTSTVSGGMKKTRLSKGKMSDEASTLQKSAVDSTAKTGRNSTVSAENVEPETKFGESLQERSEVAQSGCITPSCCPTPPKDASPVCVGNGYSKQSCRKNLSRSILWKEVKSLTASSGPTPSPASKDFRRRWRDMADVRVLYSHHLDDDTTKQQKKILVRLGASEASSISDATHFVTDRFMRTRNMLEAIALGKPVVTPQWLESCGQASCFLDERNYILRDAKKEKEIGFSMSVSLSRASRHPLLQDQRVFITASVKPSKEIIYSLVKAVGGQPTERVGRSALRNEKVPEDLLILSCEEDFDICLPFLERGASVYSLELLLNGIVIQKLEYERHRLFEDNVKRTRSTVWVKKDGKRFVPVASKHDKK